MCGIMGYVKTKGWNKDTARFLTALMVGIEIRGDHAAGVAYLPKSGMEKVGYGKRACPASQFIFGESWTEAMSYESDCLIGHARWATHGTVKNPINNHPHVSKNRRYALVHNGVITEDLGVKIEGQCDSEKILSLMKKGGVKGTLDRLSTIQWGSYAVLAIDTKAKLLHAFRNSRSPMVVSDMTDIVGGMVFCSTLEILEDALSNCEIKKQPQIYTVTPDIDFTFPVPCKPGLSALKLEVATYTKVTTYKSSTEPIGYKDYSYNGGYGGYKGGSYVNNSGTTEPATKSISPITEKERRDRWRKLSQDETPLDFKLIRKSPEGVEKTYGTWKEYFKDFPGVMGTEPPKKDDQIQIPFTEREELQKMVETISGYDEI
jgi:predicted glutamine amidotransferase